VELNSQLVAPTLTGVAAFLLAWLALGKSRSKAAKANAAKLSVPADERETKPPPASASKRAANAGAKSTVPVDLKSTANADAKPVAADSKPTSPPPKPKSTRPVAKAIVWEAPPGELADEDITVIHAIPVFEGASASDLTIEAPPFRSKVNPKTTEFLASSSATKKTPKPRK